MPESGYERGGERLGPQDRLDHDRPQGGSSTIPTRLADELTDLSELSDKDLVIAFKAGDRSAYDEIYRRYQGRIRAICRRMLHDGLDADEAAQETFLRSYTALNRFNGQYQLGAWLSRIATNICVDQLRVRQRTPDTEPHEEVLMEESAPQRPDQLVAEQIHLSKALNDIQPLHAEALLLRAVQGLSHEEMAGQLEMSAKQVKSLLHRARSSFRRAWQEASGFILAPLATTKALFGRKHPAHLNDLAGAGGQATAVTLERVAAAGVAAVLAFAGMSSSPSVDPQPKAAWPAEVMPLPPHATETTPDAPDRHRSTEATVPSSSSEPVEADEDLLPINELVFQQVEPPKDPDNDEEDDTPLSPTAASDTINEARQKVQDELGKLNELTPATTDR